MRGVVVRERSPLLKLYLQPPLMKLFIALGLCVFVSLCGFLFLRHQYQQQITANQTRKQTLQTEVNTEAKNYGELKSLSKTVSTLKIDYETLIKKFPPEFKIDDLLSNITKMGQKNQLKFISFKPESPVSGGFYSSINVDIALIGYYHQISSFLSDIINFPEAVIVVNQFTLTHTEQKDGSLRLEFVATLYYRLPGSLEIKQ